MTEYTEQVDHDQLFKELISTFFIEFIELFLPEVASSIERDSVTFLPQEYFTDLITGDRKIIDLLVKVKIRGQEVYFIIHVENQSTSEADFARRLFFYFAKLHQDYLLPVFPIAIFSFDKPQRVEPDRYQVELFDVRVLDFQFTTIQLNRLNWRDFLEQRNPVAAALMSKMKIQAQDRPKVKAECLRLLATLRLDPARTRLISGFVDTYLRLDAGEEQRFQGEVGRMGLMNEEEPVMEIVTSWMEKGAEDTVLRLLNHKLGQIDPNLEERVRGLPYRRLGDLNVAVLDFSSQADLLAWLDRQ